MNYNFAHHWAPMEPPRRISAETVDRARVPQKFWRDLIEAMADREHAEVVQDYIENLPKKHDAREGLLLYGLRGTGKSSIAAQVLIQVIKRLDPVSRGLWVSSREAARWSKPRKGWEPDNHPTIEELSWVQWLVLDELGVEHKEWDNAEIEELMKARYHNRRPTIITANFTLAELEQRYGFIDTIAENATVINVTGPTWRLT